MKRSLIRLIFAVFITAASFAAITFDKVGQTVSLPRVMSKPLPDQLLPTGLWQIDSLSTQNAETAAAHHDRGFAFHQRRCLDDASREYAEVLKLDPPRELTAEEWALVRRFAPRAYTTPTEFFPLKDFAAIIHPTERLIAYHFFWEDDIDFPEDNDPCDHEVVWVQFAPDRQTIEQVWTYFHGHILAGGEAALSDARQHQMRPRIDVQWGKHGSLLAGWESFVVKSESKGGQTITLKQYNEEDFTRLSTKGHRLLDNPISTRLGWPRKFNGSWKDFTSFSRLLDTRLWLNKSKLARVSRWNNATINQQFLPYNFRPKTEWPREMTK